MRSTVHIINNLYRRESSRSMSGERDRQGRGYTLFQADTIIGRRLLAQPTRFQS